MRNRLLFVFLILGIFIFFGPLLFLNFSQDDFYCLLISRTKDIKDFFIFFTPEHSFITSHYNFYRPLSTQLYFGLMQKIFGLNPFYFHLASLIVHVLNTFLVYKLAKEFTKNFKISLLAAFIFGINQSLAVSIGWASNSQELLVTTFILLGLLFFKKRRDFTSLILFILALLSKETAITFPVVLFFMTFLDGKKKDLLRIIPFVIVLIFYLYMHFVKFHFVQTESYTLLVNFQAANTFKWYVWWALGLPEMFLDYIGPRFSVSPQLWKMFFKESIMIFSLFILLNFTIISAFIFKLKNINKVNLKVPVFFSLFYLTFLLPIIFFPQNKYPYHQTTSLAGMAVFLAIIIGNCRKLLIIAFILFFSILQFYSYRLTLKTNPIMSRAGLVDLNLKPFMKEYPSLPENTVIYIKNDPNYPYISDSWGGTAKQMSIAVSRENAFKVYYGNSIKVYYEGVNELPEKIETPKFIEITAKVPY